jgi:hypothetical protein
VEIPFRLASNFLENFSFLFLVFFVSCARRLRRRESRDENTDADVVITFRYLHLHHTITICIRAVITVIIYYSAYEVMSLLEFKIVVYVSKKYKNTLSIVEHYYSNHTR